MPGKSYHPPCLLSQQVSLKEAMQDAWGSHIRQFSISKNVSVKTASEQSHYIVRRTQTFEQRFFVP